MINHGVKLGQRPEDYQAGAFTFISYEVRNPSGDWKPYLPTKEKQYGAEDSLSCVSFSATSSIEIQVKFLTGKEVNYSDRWIAKMSGTDREGNWLYKVGDAVRHFGLVPEEAYPAPLRYTFDQYHAPIPEPLLSTLKAKGQEWLKRWDVKTEFIPATKEMMLKHLKHAPLQIIVPGHAIVNFLCEADVVHYFDTYDPHLKTTKYGNVQSVYKYVLTPKTMQEKPKHVIINDGGKLYFIVLQGFCVGGAAAKSMDAAEQLKSALEFPADTPIINLP